MKMPSDQPYYGSSPLTRGTQGKTYKELDVDRFIPAYAGNSSVSHGGFYGEPVHPRLRGELGLLVFILSTLSRFIPAYAGNSQERYAEYRYKPVHPRLRGELFWKRVRKRGVNRFIPAYAGNSLRKVAKTGVQAVHPRLRGELSYELLKEAADRGSSPLTRGTHLKWLQHYTNRLTAKLLKNISKQE